MFRKTLSATILMLGTVLIYAAPALASGGSYSKTPAPGVLSIVAIGMAGAIFLARRRK